MKRDQILDATENILNESGFCVSERCISRPSCFDIVARRKDQLVFVKVPGNMGNISEKDAFELHTISKRFSAKPLFVSDGTSTKSLEDDTVYMRYNVWMITLKTLEDIIVRGLNPLVEAGPGGYYVNLDFRVIREKRQCLGLSVGKLAEMGGTSRRTLYGYEKGMAKASVSVAYNLSRILGVPVVQPLNFFEMEHTDTGFFSKSKQIVSRQHLLQKIMKYLSHLNMRTFLASKAPFDFIAQYPEKKLSIIGGVAGRKERNVDQRAKEILSVCETIKAQPFFVGDDQQTSNNRVRFFHQEDLERIASLEEFVKNL